MFAGLMAAALLTCSCGGKEETGIRDDSDLLYGSTVRVARQYADSLRAASDSAAVIEAFNRFNTVLDSINFSVEANTDLLLTEAENDTLYREIMKVKEIYLERLEALDHNRKNIEEEEPETAL